ncbi:MAG: crossover junction endodeoxyribonuclease RuvC [Candidatus Latescibacteria bacterium]|nr:crossover junction endodeoxyribonuclease RuvC [Candidatus Latescibacterota bacterium]MBT4137244.1 crossover junction endodeoxyribonuclease RuvC [Candidatus Latescibacterota bacterium]
MAFVIILGIDPGSVITGYGVIEHQNRKNKLLRCGTIRPEKDVSFSQRLLFIYDHLLEVVSDVSPDEVAIESVFYGVNTQSLIKLCQARGAILTALANSDLPIFEYAPREIKKAVVGRGGASKEQVQFMMERLFGKKALADTFDATDGVATALCHAHQKTGPLAGAGNGNNLADKLEALQKEGRGANRFNEKLKQAGVDVKVRQRLVPPHKRGR